MLAPPSHPHRDEPSVLTAYTSPIVTYNELYRIVNIAPELDLVKELPRQVIYLFICLIGIIILFLLNTVLVFNLKAASI